MIRILEDRYAATFSKRGLFLGGLAAINRHPVGSELWHDDAIWLVYMINRFHDEFLFYTIRQRTHILGPVDTG